MAPLSATESYPPRPPCDLSPESSPLLDKKKISSFSPLARSGRKSLSVLRSVSFSSNIAVVPVAHLNCLSEEDFAATWCTEDEYKTIKRIYKATARMIMRGEVVPEDDEHICSRGLESKTRNDPRRRHHQKDRVRKSLLKAQDFQQRERLNDPLYLAELYAEYSRPDCMLAVAQGILDQEAVRQIMSTWSGLESGFQSLGVLWRPDGVIGSCEWTEKNLLEPALLVSIVWHRDTWVRWDNPGYVKGKSKPTFR
jgi:hypothetical protein